MKLLTYAQSLHDLNFLKEEGITEVILAHKSLARFGKLDTAEFIQMSNRAKDLGLRTLCEWDILMTENTFAKVATEIPALLEHFDALRVQDPGALEWSIHHTTKPLQFIAENGNHNLKALESWISHAGNRIERVVLSIELSKSIIEEYVQKLSVPCELLGFGRILLFYTPRSLLSPLSTEKVTSNEEILALGESEESPHKGFPLVENRHGTFMFHIKEFCLLEYAKDLSEMGLAFFRVDLRWEEMRFLTDIKNLTKNFEAEKFESFKEQYPQDLMRGFYLVNKTDVLFPKLKNHRLQKREGDYVGEVMEAEKGAHLAIMVKHSRGLTKNDLLKIVHPKGDIIEAKVFTLRNAALEEVDHIPAGKLALMQFVGGVWVKSQIFYQD